MKPLAPILLALSVALFAQSPTAPFQAGAQADQAEQNELTQALAEAGNSPVDFSKALERHLQKHPDTKLRAPIEKGLVKTAMEQNDMARILLYGENVLNAEKPDDLQLIDRLAHGLVDQTEPATIKKGLEYARRYEADVVALRSTDPPGHLTPGQWSVELDKAAARALALEARALGNLGKAEDAVASALKSWNAFPTGEAAREAGHWYSVLKRTPEALEYYANAFALEDPRTTEADRVRDRTRLGALYAQTHPTEQGLGDILLAAYDRTEALMNERRASLRAKDPNAQATAIQDFVLPTLDGSAPVAISSLKGKTVVLDFWATWCAPCRAQKPMIENVRKHFENADDIVFLPVDSDDDRSIVAPFVKEQGWNEKVYFEGGLARVLSITSIPTVLILNPSGEVSSRMIGFIPDRFEAMLTERISEARGK